VIAVAPDTLRRAVKVRAGRASEAPAETDASPAATSGGAERSPAPKPEAAAAPEDEDEDEDDTDASWSGASRFEAIIAAAAGAMAGGDALSSTLEPRNPIGVDAYCEAAVQERYTILLVLLCTKKYPNDQIVPAPTNGSPSESLAKE
jgi:hypothetical protein